MRFNFIELMKIADQASMNSKDQSTKVGATFINRKTGFPIGYGYNGMPRGMEDDNPERNERPEKYKWSEHAERNNLYNIARETLEGKRILSLCIPNMESARALVSSGIKEIVSFEDYALINSDPEPTKEIKRVLTLFAETGVNFIAIKEEEVKNAKYEKLVSHLMILKQVAKAQSTGSVRDAAAIYTADTTTPVQNGFGVSERFDVGTIIVNGKELEYDKSELELEAIKAAIFNHIRPKLEDCIGVVSWCPCIKCSIAMMKSGVTEINTRELNLEDENDQRWETSFKLSEALLPKLGVTLNKLAIPKITQKEFEEKTLFEDMPQNNKKKKLKR